MVSSAHRRKHRFWGVSFDHELQKLNKCVCTIVGKDKDGRPHFVPKKPQNKEPGIVFRETRRLFQQDKNPTIFFDSQSSRSTTVATLLGKVRQGGRYLGSVICTNPPPSSGKAGSGKPLPLVGRPHHPRIPVRVPTPRSPPETG